MPKKVLLGKVVSDKTPKTRVVEVEYTYRHPLYKKVVRKKHRFYTHDDDNISRTGDWVRIEESRPLSHLKRWSLLEVVRSSEMEKKENDSTL